MYKSINKVLWFRRINTNRRFCSETKDKPKESAEVTTENIIPKKKSKIPKLIGFTLFAGSGFLAGCYFSDDFRALVESQVPYSKTALDTVFSYIPSFDISDVLKQTPAAENSKKSVDISTKSKLMGQITSSDVSSNSKSNLPTQSLSVPKEIKKGQETVSSPKEKPVVSHEEFRKKEAERNAMTNQALTLSINSLITKTAQAVSEAISVQNSQETAIRNYTNLVKKAMEDDNISKKDEQWLAVSHAYDKKQDMTRKANKYVEEAKKALDKMKENIDTNLTNKVTRDNEALREAQKKLTELQYNFSTSSSEVSKALSEATLMVQYKDLVEKGKQDFQRELKSVLPDPEVLMKSSGMTDVQLNSLIAHAHRRIEQLQKHLAEQEVMEKIRVSEALTKQREDDDLHAKELVTRELERQERNFQLDKQALERACKLSYEEELKQALAVQAAAHSDHATQLLSVQRDELSRQYDANLRLALLKEKEQFQLAIEIWTNRVLGIEAAVEGRADLIKQSHKVQALWLACQSFLADFQYGSGGTPNQPKHLILTPYLEKISQFAGDSPFIQTLLSQFTYRNSLTNENNKKNDDKCYPMEDLYTRFSRVKRACKKVALIDEHGATMGMFFLSWLQSLFIINNAAKSTAEFDKLNTYDILAQAERFIFDGNLEGAVGLMAQLKGMPRVLADDWLLESRKTLEALQTARALTAYAAAFGAVAVTTPTLNM